MALQEVKSRNSILEVSGAARRCGRGADVRAQSPAMDEQQRAAAAAEESKPALNALPISEQYTWDLCFVFKVRSGSASVGVPGGCRAAIACVRDVRRLARRTRR